MNIPTMLKAIVAIKLGRSNLCVAVCHQTDKVSVVPSSIHGHTTWPAMIAYHNSDEAVVGFAAKNLHMVYLGALLHYSPLPPILHGLVLEFLLERYSIHDFYYCGLKDKQTDRSTRIPVSFWTQIRQSIEGIMMSDYGRSRLSYVLLHDPGWGDNMIQLLSDDAKAAGMNVLRIVCAPVMACVYFYHYQKTYDDDDTCNILVCRMGASSLTCSSIVR